MTQPNTNGTALAVRDPQQDDGFTVGEAIPASAQLVRAHVATRAIVELDSPEQIASYIRQRDDAQMLAQMMGELTEDWFYDFKVGGKAVEGVSVVGAMEFSRIRAEQGFPIRFPPGAILVEELSQNGELGIRVTVVARDARTGAEGIGMAFYPWNAKRQDGSRYPDDKADRKALSVAKRNAIIDLVPEAIIRTVLKERRKYMKANEERQRLEAERAVREQIASAKPVHAISPTQHHAETSADPYAAGEVSEAGRFIMPFGKRKDTRLADLDSKEIEGAMNWAREKGKFTEFVEAAGEVLAERAGGTDQLPLDDRRPGRDAVERGQ